VSSLIARLTTQAGSASDGSGVAQRDVGRVVVSAHFATGSRPG